MTNWRQKEKKAKSIFQGFSLKSTFKRELMRGKDVTLPEWCWSKYISSEASRICWAIHHSGPLPRKKKQIMYWKLGLAIVYCKYIYDTATKECCCVQRKENSCNILPLKRTALSLTLCVLRCWAWAQLKSLQSCKASRHKDESALN